MAYNTLMFMLLHAKITQQHEEGSCSLLDQLIESNDLKDEFAKYGLNFDEDLPFIKELINPPQLTEVNNLLSIF